MLHATWSEACRLVRMPHAPELRLHDPLDPENLPETDRDVSARNWMKEWAKFDKSPTKKRTIHFPVFPKQPWEHKCASPKHKKESPTINNTQSSFELLLLSSLVSLQCSLHIASSHLKSITTHVKHLSLLRVCCSLQ